MKKLDMILGAIIAIIIFSAIWVGGVTHGRAMAEREQAAREKVTAVTAGTTRYIRFQKTKDGYIRYDCTLAGSIITDEQEVAPSDQTHP